MSPLRLFRSVAVAEAVTWALLLLGMYLRYVPETTELGVRVFGMLHGVVLIAYCLTAVVVAVDQRWGTGRTVAALVAAVPPFATAVFDRVAERRGWLATSWRLTSPSSSAPRRSLDRPVGWLLRHPLPGMLAGGVAVLALSGLALLVGPPA